MAADFEMFHSVESVPPDIDAVVILGKQLGIGSSLDDIKRTSDRLSMASRFNVIAGAMLWQPDRRLIISGNENAFFPQAATAYLEAHFPHIPAASYSDPDVHSHDTQASAENVPPILKHEGLTDPIIASVGKHGIRAAQYFYHNDTAVRGVAVSEDIVASLSYEDAEVVRVWQHKLTTSLEVGKEALLRKLGRNGSKLRFISNLVRP
jgi:hypothetical protein